MPDYQPSALEQLFTLLTGTREAEANPFAQKLARRAMSAMSDLGTHTTAPPGTLSMFIGPKSVKWNAPLAARFEKLESSGLPGMTPESLWRQTGTFRGPEGKLRQEISDVGARVSPPNTLIERRTELERRAEELTARNKEINEVKKIQKDFFPTKLNEAQRGLRAELSGIKGQVKGINQLEDTGAVDFATAIEHPELVEAYPSVTGVRVAYPTGGDPNELGSMLGNRMAIGPAGRVDPEQARSTALHELQHWIQDQESFAPGGNPSAIAQLKRNAERNIADANSRLPLIASKLEQARAAGDTEQIARWQKEYDWHLDKRAESVPFAQLDPYEDYRRLAGETEARLTQARRDLTAKERASRYPYLDLAPEDAAPEKQLVIDWNEAMNMREGGAVESQDYDAGGIVRRGYQAALEHLARNYPTVASQARLQEYVAKRLPHEYKSLQLTPLGSGTGRKAFALGEDLVVKVPRLPRGVMEQRLAGDYYAPIPELVHRTDDDLMTIVRRAQKADAELRKKVRNVQTELGRAGYAHPERSGAFQEAITEAGFPELMDYNTLWGDVAPRNVGLIDDAPVVIDEGVLSRDILNPERVIEEVDPALWGDYRRDVLRRADGGLVDEADAPGVSDPDDQGWFRFANGGKVAIGASADEDSDPTDADDAARVDSLLNKLRLAVDAGTFQDEYASGIGGGGSVDYQATPNLNLGADFSGYRVKTPEGTEKRLGLDALRARYNVGPHEVYGRKGLGQDNSWNIGYTYSRDF